MIIVTGGAGFIGSNLLAELEARTHEDLVVCDRLGTDDKWRNISKRTLRDIVAPENLFAYLEEHAAEVKVVFHLGAIASSTEMNADMIVENNFTLSRLLWKWCAEHEVRFIYGSTFSTYGNGECGFNDDETMEGVGKLKPLNPYGWSKHLFDKRVISLVNGPQKGKEKVPPQWVGLKFFNVYGPNEYHKGDQRSVLCKLYPQVVAGASARLFKSHHQDYEDGGQLRDFIWIGDCVDVMMWFYENPTKNGLFNLGTGKARSFKDLAIATFAAAGLEPKITYIEMPQELRAKYQYFTEANMEKLRSVGYTKDFKNLEDGVREYVSKYLSQTDAYR
ncbi:MAG: ADP-glyceromanno-heptose 6-epimerase [Rhodospirillales bacterium]|nr:ADP-glyceromanno-heptose 6-epimerase [Rhodospirillales bacterium]MCB9973571.1 ADP-glyceromanno-heptose 6-epimerase [Rhodospirillales bacterium]MCB9979625.1 ADP-glyceromanno-heptose 6-epimerase [Rhodospirillales bacterium]